MAADSRGIGVAMRFISGPAWSIAALLFLSSAAWAQSFTPVSIEGRIDADDARDAGDRPYDSYRIHLSSGQRYRISVDSGAFDPMIGLVPVGEEEPVAEDDDGGESLNALLFFSPAKDGDFDLRVTGFAADAAGPYSLRIEALPPYPPPISAIPVSGETTTWTVYEDALSDTDPENARSRFDDYLFFFEEGSKIMIGVDSGDFDPVVQIQHPDARDGEPLAGDDDGGGGNNALLVFRAPESGNYIVRVAGFETGSLGSYRLKIGR